MCILLLFNFSVHEIIKRECTACIALALTVCIPFCYERSHFVFLLLGENHGVLTALLLTAVVNDRLINSHQIYLACSIAPPVIKGSYSKLPLKEPGEFLAQGVGTAESGTTWPASCRAIVIRVSIMPVANMVAIINGSD